MKFKVINAGNCMLCGRKIKIVAKRDSNKFPSVFFCSRCERRRVNKDKAERSDKECMKH